MLKNGEWWEVDSNIRSNYSHNGYTTRVGIKRANLARCKEIAKSHDLIPSNGKLAHDARVRLRN